MAIRLGGLFQFLGASGDYRRASKTHVFQVWDVGLGALAAVNAKTLNAMTRQASAEQA
jgi:hypothetical protein